MPSAGNDIVSLDLINKQRSNDSRFYRKIITAEEEMMYSQSLCPNLPFENFVWLCWSIKESAYKFIKRSDAGYLFSPVKISINSIALPSEAAPTVLLNTYSEEDDPQNAYYAGMVTVAGKTLYFRSKICQNTIASVVCETPCFKDIFWGIRHIEFSDSAEQSKEVRALVLQKLAQIFPEKKLNIPQTSGSYPVLMEGTDELSFPLSLAHHGNMVAYSLNLQPQTEW